MITFPAKARTTADGTLSLAIPTGCPDADVEVLVILDVVPNDPIQYGASSWPSGYFERFFGSLRDEGLIRHPQGMSGSDEIEERNQLD
jgi:hypothetical protein